MNWQRPEVLVFEVGGQCYALPSSDVRELVRAVAVRPLPGAPAIVEGIINLRGELVPVLDLRARLRLPPRELRPSDHFIVAEVDGRRLALRVDRALELVVLDQADVEEARSLVAGVDYVRWVARRPEDVLLIHDLRTFLSQTEAIALDQALAQPHDREEVAP
jgi:purine-binding chemotaxis protein CheW